MGFVTPSASRRWRGGIVPFVIHNSLTGNNRRTVQSAINHWNSQTCLRLVRRRRQSNFVEFRRSASACQSPVGRQGGRQIISCAVGAGFGRGSVIHEIGHSVGMFHEHTRPDRDIFVVVSSGVLNNINYKMKNDLVVGPYDCGSIMHYPPIANRIQPVPGQCAGMGQRAGLSASDIAAVEYMYRFIRSGDSANRAGASSEIIVANQTGRRVVTAVRTGSGRLKLISWQVNPGGTVVRRGDSGNQAGAASHIDLARVSPSRFVAACRTSSGRLRLINWRVNTNGSISRLGDSGNQAGRATQIEIVSLGSGILVTACRTASGNLRLISWRLQSSGNLARLSDTRNAAGGVSDISMAAFPDNFPARVATTVRTSNGSLKVIVWRVRSTGSISRRGDSGNAAGAATMVRSAIDGFGNLQTSCRTGSGNLRVISWRVNGAGTFVNRIGDSGNQAGGIGDNSLVIHDNSRAISAVRTSSGNLRVIGWTLGGGGAVVREGDSDNQAGRASHISLNPQPLSGTESVVSAVRTAQGRLKLISWEVC